ncbi:hypothetical protein [Roseivivax sp. CAU 1753]
MLENAHLGEIFLVFVDRSLALIASGPVMRAVRHPAGTRTARACRLGPGGAKGVLRAASAAIAFAMTATKIDRRAYDGTR